MKTPKLSIVTVCLNSGATIGATLESVARQTYPNIEHIIVDGGSTDDTLEVVRQWRDHPVRLTSQADDGIYDAMNRGVALATGDIIGFLNADDLFARDSVVAQVAGVFQNQSVQVCYADLVYVRRDDVNRVVRYWKSSEYRDGAFSRGWCPAHPTYYARSTVYERFGSFDLRYKLAADADLMIRTLEKGKLKAVYVPEIWVKMRVGGQTNLSFRNIVRQNREILDSLNRHGVRVSSMAFIISKLLTRVVQRWSRAYAE